MNISNLGRVCSQLVNPTTNPALFDWNDCEAPCPLVHRCVGLKGFPSIYQCIPSGFADGNIWIFGLFMCLAVLFAGFAVGIVVAHAERNSGPKQAGPIGNADAVAGNAEETAV